MRIQKLRKKLRAEQQGKKHDEKRANARQVRK